jgi:protein O-mannosyl-transferase
MKKSRISRKQPQDRTLAKPTLTRRFARPEGIIVLAAVVSDLNSWGHQFLMDDLSYIMLNKTLQSPHQIFQIFTAPFSHALASLYRPLTSLTLAINVWTDGLHPDGFHLFNRLLHILICLCIFWTVRLLIPKPSLAALSTALLFAVHPVQVEAITYITGRSDALVTLFFMAALYFFIRLRLSEEWSIRPYGLSLTFHFLAILSKENAITWLGVALLTEYLYLSRHDSKAFLQSLRRHFWSVYAGYFLASLIFVGISFAVLKSLGAGDTPTWTTPLPMCHSPAVY